MRTRTPLHFHSADEQKDAATMIHELYSVLFASSSQIWCSKAPISILESKQDSPRTLPIRNFELALAECLLHCFAETDRSPESNRQRNGQPTHNWCYKFMRLVCGCVLRTFSSGLVGRCTVRKSHVASPTARPLTTKGVVSCRNGIDCVHTDKRGCHLRVALHSASARHLQEQCTCATPGRFQRRAGQRRG
jgi:hypothetical protein